MTHVRCHVMLFIWGFIWLYIDYYVLIEPTWSSVGVLTFPHYFQCQVSSVKNKKRFCRHVQDSHPAWVNPFDVPSNIVSLATRSHLNFTVPLFSQRQALSKEPVWMPCCSVATLYFHRFCRSCFKGSFSQILPLLCRMSFQ